MNAKRPVRRKASRVKGAGAGLALALAAVLVMVDGYASEFRITPQPLKSEVARELLTSLGVAEHTDQRLNAVVNELMPRRDRRLIPLWQEQYEKATVHEDKLMPASLLVFLGAGDPKFWNYLYGEARSAVESGMPARAEIAELIEEPSDLRAWREQRGLTAQQAADLRMRQIITMIALGAAVDVRAFDLLVACLAGPNHFLYPPCMQGLARLQDKRAIEPIISALERVDTRTASGAAWFLLYFDDPRAQETAEQFIVDEKLLLAYRKKAAEGVQEIYGY